MFALDHGFFSAPRLISNDQDGRLHNRRAVQYLETEVSRAHLRRYSFIKQSRRLVDRSAGYLDNFQIGPFIAQ